MKLNETLISHYTCQAIPVKKLKELVKLKEEYLKEKPTWYMIGGKLKYFKVRNDFRLFTEQFFSKFGKLCLGLDTLDYSIGVVRVCSLEDPKDCKKQIGLLSTNFQKKDKNYYLLSEMFDPEVSDLKGYGYSLESVINFLANTVSNKDYINCKDFLVKLFLADAFTMQLDRNPNNIGFEIQTIEGVHYLKRLRPEMLKKSGACSKKYVVEENGFTKLVGLMPSKVYDNERILGVDHKKVFLWNQGDIWTPIWPYSEDLLFESQEQARKVQSQVYGGVDPNITECIANHPEYLNVVEQLATDDYYKKILEEFTITDNSNKHEETQIQLKPESAEYFLTLLGERKKEFQRVLRFFK